MLELAFTASDVANTRFALSPLWEVVASVRVLKRPGEHAFYRPWIEKVTPRLEAARVDWRPLLGELVPASPGRIPVFIAPPPTTPVPDLAVELAGLRITPPDRVREGLDAMHTTGSARLQGLHSDPEAGLAELAEVIDAYWQTAIAPYWPRMLTLLESELLHRARRLAERGAQQLLGDLDPKVAWESDTMFVNHLHTHGTRHLDGRGLLLVPSIFTWPNVFSVLTTHWQPTLRYPPRGLATLWERDRDTAKPAIDALTAVIGKSRATLLAELDAPASTTDLARRTGLTPGGVSQHLSTLRTAGLVNAHRTGRYVLYARTHAAEALLNAARRGERAQ